MLGMEEERFPSYYSLKDNNKLQEERRVCFVCISRAKKACVLVRSKYYTFDTRRGPWRKNFSESRFWTALASEYGDSFNEKSFNIG